MSFHHISSIICSFEEKINKQKYIKVDGADEKKMHQCFFIECQTYLSIGEVNSFNILHFIVIVTIYFIHLL